MEKSQRLLRWKIHGPNRSILKDIRIKDLKRLHVVFEKNIHVLLLGIKPHLYKMQYSQLIGIVCEYVVQLGSPTHN